MTTIKLLALDLDGTLFNSQKEVSAENKKALQEARACGVKVVITTGRPLRAIGNLLEELDLIGQEEYSITFNGGLIQRNTGDILYKKELTFEEVEQITTTMLALDLPVDILSEGNVYSLASRHHRSHYPLANPMLTFIQLNTLDDLPRDIVYNKVVIVNEESYLNQQMKKIPADLYEAFELFKSREIILEIMPKGVHKAVGLEKLANLLGLDASQVMAMGDEANDLSMLEWAGLGIAMSNATDEVKIRANAVTSKTNDQSGVAEAVHRYILQGDNHGII